MDERFMRLHEQILFLVDKIPMHNIIIYDWIMRQQGERIDQ